MDEPLIIRKPISKEDYELMNDLIVRILKKPVNYLINPEKDGLESQSYPYMTFFKNRIVATVRFQKTNENNGQIKDLAVEEEFRRNRIATKLVRFIEGLALCLGIKKIALNPTYASIKFFEKLDYKIMEEESNLVNQKELITMGKELNLNK
jgi:N-acetylglutamate synthase-like GNAT family acetyltransferase